MTKMPPRDESIPGAANIADPFRDLLLLLDQGRRQGFIRRLAVGYYEDWRPTRAEVAFLIDVELGRKSMDDSMPTLDSTLYSDAAVTRPEPVTVESSTDDITAGSDDRHLLRAAVDPPSATRARVVPSALATFNVDCGLLATPCRFIAYGVSSAGWTVRMGDRYRRAFLHYRLVSGVRPVAAPSRSTKPMLFSGEIICVPDIAAPYAAEDGRSRHHSARASAVLGSRGPWPIPEDAKVIDFLISAQTLPGNRQRRQPAGSLRVDLRGGTARWLASHGREQTGSDRAAAR